MEFLFLIIIGFVIYSGVQAVKKMTNGSVVPEIQKRVRDLVTPQLPEELFLEQYEYNEIQGSDKNIKQTEHTETVTRYKPVNNAREETIRGKVKRNSSSYRQKIKIQSREEARRAIIYSEIIKRKY